MHTRETRTTLIYEKRLCGICRLQDYKIRERSMNGLWRRPRSVDTTQHWIRRLMMISIWPRNATVPVPAWVAKSTAPCSVVAGCADHPQCRRKVVWFVCGCWQGRRSQNSSSYPGDRKANGMTDWRACPCTSLLCPPTYDRDRCMPRIHINLSTAQ